MNFLDATTAPNQPLIEAGRMFVIRCMPDPFTGEILNIGVCAIDSDGRRSVKVIKDAGRLECLYGKAASNVVAIAHTAGEAAKQGNSAPSDYVIFDTPQPFYNQTAEEVVNATFNDQVTVALPLREVPTIKPLKLKDAQAQTTVFDWLKVNSSMPTDYIANTSQVVINTDNNGARSVNIPIQPANGVGVIRSANYSAATLKTHLMDSVLDLDFAARYREKAHSGLFILRPACVNDQAAYAIDSAIDSVLWRAPKALRVEVRDNAPELAVELERWALQAV